MSNSQPEVSEDINKKIKDIFGVDPNTLRSPTNRPTKLMRELYKNSGHEISKWREYFEPNATILQDFIRRKCLILDEDVPHTWLSIMNSMTQMPYDAIKYKSKSNSANVTPTTPKLIDPIVALTTSFSPQSLSNDNGQEQ